MCLLYALYTYLLFFRQMKNFNNSLHELVPLFLFKDGIRPVWEDDKNKAGGKWVFQPTFTESHQQLLKKINDYWLNIVSFVNWLIVFAQALSCIGNQFGDCNDAISGCVLNIKRTKDKKSNYRFTIWTAVRDEKSCLTIGKKFKEVTNSKMGSAFKYFFHADVDYKVRYNL